MSELSREEVLKLAKEHGLFGGFRPLPCNESQVVWFATAIYNKAKREILLEAAIAADADGRGNLTGYQLRKMADELKGGEQLEDYQSDIQAAAGGLTQTPIE